VTRLFGGSATEKGVALGSEVSTDFFPHRQGDPARLRQIVSNLVSNALKFTSQGSVEVRVSDTDAGGVRIEISDTGIGISADKLEGLFEPFTQADASTTRRFGGTGLGLAISRRLCTAMGGRIWAISTPGEGSTFTVELPLARVETELVEVEKPAETQPLPPLHVLVAEDHPTNQLVLRHLLQNLGLSCEVVADGKQAVDRVATGGIDLVLMDIHMPVMDGHEASRVIRSLPGPESRVPIVAVSASTLAADQEACRQARMNDHIGKPVRLERLRDLIGALPVQGARWPGPQALG
jgi:CheY-like chemotaxis protein